MKFFFQRRHTVRRDCIDRPLGSSSSKSWFFRCTGALRTRHQIDLHDRRYSICSMSFGQPLPFVRVHCPICNISGHARNQASISFYFTARTEMVLHTICIAHIYIQVIMFFIVTLCYYTIFNITITILDIIHYLVFYLELSSTLSIPHTKFITSPLRAQQVNIIYRFVTMVY
jgi:hypothetical protein